MRRSTTTIGMGRRCLLTAGLVTAVVLLPGTATAADDAASLPVSATEVLDQPVAVPDGAESGGGGGELTPPPEGGFPVECAAGLEAGVALIGTGIGAIPAELAPTVLAALGPLDTLAGSPDDVAVVQDVRDAVTALLDGDASGAPILEGLDLVLATLAECLPEEPPVEEPPVEEPPAEEPPVVEKPVVEKPVVQNPPAAAPSAGPAPKPVVYPGYAPTGGDAADEASAAGPLAAVGGVALLLGAATAEGLRRRGRAVPSQD